MLFEIFFGYANRVLAEAHRIFNLRCSMQDLYFGVNEFRSLVYALSYMLVHLVIAVIMYKKKIFIKL